jgi:hypothetical protein
MRGESRKWRARRTGRMWCTSNVGTPCHSARPVRARAQTYHGACDVRSKYDEFYFCN